MFHPWREFRERWPNVRLIVRALPAGVVAATDGRRVWMHDRLLQRERRVAIAHEMVHLERGDVHAQDPVVEAAVDREVARRLISIEALVDALAWDQRVEVLADELWVTPGIVKARIEGLTEDEAAVVTAALEV